MAGAGAALAWGFLAEDVTVFCASRVPAGGSCPGGDIVEESSERSNLPAALAVAGVVTVLSAIDAAVAATRHNETARAARAEPWIQPWVQASPSGQVALGLSIPIRAGGRR